MGLSLSCLPRLSAVETGQKPSCTRLQATMAQDLTRRSSSISPAISMARRVLLRVRPARFLNFHLRLLPAALGPTQRYICSTTWTALFLSAVCYSTRTATLMERRIREERHQDAAMAVVSFSSFPRVRILGRKLSCIILLEAMAPAPLVV
jgi:hypothetical protein